MPISSQRPHGSSRKVRSKDIRDPGGAAHTHKVVLLKDRFRKFLTHEQGKVNFLEIQRKIRRAQVSDFLKAMHEDIFWVGLQLECQKRGWVMRLDGSVESLE